jgi:GTP cyclohydrolase I
MDRTKMEAAIREFLDGMGLDIAAEELVRTPARVARAWSEDLLSGYAVDADQELTWTPAEAGCGPVVVRQVSLASVCIHHLLPFSGFAHVAYLPDRRLAGLSKIGRVIDAHARRLQTQERLSTAIVSTLQRVLEPRGALVLLEAEHTCMTLRGVRKELSRMVTAAASGIYETDPAARSEILGLLRAEAGRSPLNG